MRRCPAIAPAIKLLAYANPATGSLEQTAHAEELVKAIHACQNNFIELDFSGVEGVSTEFRDQFLRLAGSELGETWLTPRNYGPSCNRLVKCLLSRLKRQREGAWINGCEAFTTGIRSQAAHGQTAE